MKPLLAAFVLAGALAPLAAQPPQAVIASRKIKATLYLPDPDRGYYRGTRFDWSGSIASLETNGHTYFGKWFDRYDPKTHDAITGPVEEFLTGDSALGYDEARPGETFVRIGVGTLRKIEEPRFERFKTYEIVDPGKRTMRHGADWIEFTHKLTGPGGYAYLYTKRLSLTRDQAELVISHTLKNTGKKAIDTSVYNHDFFMIDGLPTSPDVRVTFPFAPQASGKLAPFAELDGKELRYTAELSTGQSAAAELTGYGATAADYDFRVENRKAGAGVRQRGDLPLSKLYFWSIRTTVCPEAYVHLHIEPGQAATWKIRYEFYNL
ncbi:MAG: hypothetical protein KGN36_10850 [Acidobacteriota bacterium]|nr:hypothetical protein [Acidobacteriota bacterium]